MTGRLFIIAGPAGAGKNRLMATVMEHGLVRQLATATTRAIRPGEEQGREHLFVSRAEFDRMIAEGELLEWQAVHDNLYGIHQPTLEAALQAGTSLIADIDIRGARAARAALGQRAVVIFVQAPTMGTLIDRMRLRGETTASLGLRLLRVEEEMAFMAEADALIVNDDADNASNKLEAIIRAVQADGAATPYCDEPVAVRYKLCSQVIIMAEGYVLSRRRAPEYPYTACLPGEQPVAAARRALADSFPALATNLTQADPAAYRAPLVIDYRRDPEGIDIVTYSYGLSLPARFAPQDGWFWTETAL